MITQASWVRSLLTSFVKSWDSRSIGGLFGSAVGEHETVLSWSRLEQAAFLIVIGQVIQEAIANKSEPWMKALRKQEVSSLFPEDKDLAFFGLNNLINSDQGGRVLLQVANDLCFIRADELCLHEWGGHQQAENSDEENINVGINSLKKQQKIYDYLKQLSVGLASYDWRSSSGPGLTEDERTRKAAFRGSGGYRELRRDVLLHLSRTESAAIAQAANEVIERLDY